MEKIAVPYDYSGSTYFSSIPNSIISTKRGPLPLRYDAGIKSPSKRSKRPSSYHKAKSISRRKDASHPPSLRRVYSTTPRSTHRLKPKTIFQDSLLRSRLSRYDSSTTAASRNHAPGAGAEAGEMEVEVDGAVVEAAAGVETGEELNTVESVVFQIIEGK